MANLIYVCCRSERPITYGELEDYMGHWGWLDEPATFEPPLDQVDPANPAWAAFTLTFRPGRRPIDVRHFFTPEEIRPVLDEIIEQMDDEDLVDDHAAVVTHLRETKQVVMFELPAELPPDVWEMLDATEANLAREWDGIVVADEGVYDAALAQIFKWP
jgi:hypothetical protein